MKSESAVEQPKNVERETP